MLNVTPMVRNLLLINVALLLLEATGALGNVARLLALHPWTSALFLPTQHLTYMFMHAGLGHLFGNMFGLFSFGPMLEMRWGPQRFLAFWLICGVGAGLLYSGIRQYELTKMRADRNAFVEHPTGVAYSDYFRDYFPNARGYEMVASALQKDPGNTQLVQGAVRTVDDIYDGANNAPMVGASGALFGILLAFAYLFPNTELMLLFFPVPIKAKYFVALYGLYELYAGVQRAPGDTVAHFAHLGGMLFGFLLLKYWERNSSRFY
ncbi:rhomboid family intramembrane serine protease [Hymenobacter jeollabukensis]|uniref:Rhomboid family intramembrane serine protease n=1 Tax=Hymenobacter jeollabukensis TaxID=2025313 RepID=A0A5R8WRC9_9BACT|nr:rhomboid family intramembrane serine protease [Hymenobacter jeollabukensis]TLM93289.1 rhomboid family intramembrane serine protease [Hymenobacter jeollabukensis]